MDQTTNLIQGKEIVVEVRKDGTLAPLCDLNRQPKKSIRTAEKFALDANAKDGRTYLTIKILSDPKTVKMVQLIQY